MATIYTANPGSLPARREHDHYPTDEGTVRAALTQYLKVNEHWFLPRIALDPGCGAGVWGKVLQELLPSPRVLIGADIRELGQPKGYDAVLCGDFLDEWFQAVLAEQAKDTCGFDLIIGNPPYKHSEAFVRASFDLLNEGGSLLFLLRLTFLESQRRGRGLWRECPARRVWVCSRRPSFTGDGRTSPDAYAVFWWSKGWTGETSLGWLEGTRKGSNDHRAAVPVAGSGEPNLEVAATGV